MPPMPTRAEPVIPGKVRAGAQREREPAIDAPHANAPCLPGRGVCISDQWRFPMFEGQSQTEIEAILKADTEFRQLYYRHRELDKQVLDAELGVLPVDDAKLASMKREKLAAKDRLTRMYAAHLRH